MSKKQFGFFLGPLVFIIVGFVISPDGLNSQAQAVLASTLWIAIWWITEAVPISATALLPLILFPVTNGLSIKHTVTGYSHPYIFLFMGGFMLAIAMEKWNLHKRIALYIISKVGFSPSRIILGFMVATGFLSMWISNTATAVMMLPIGMAIVSQKKDSGDDVGDFGKALMLGIAYSASIGGIATLIGTPPNLILAGVIEKTYGFEISFGQWITLGLPFAVLMLFICWYYLTNWAFKLNSKPVDGASSVSDALAALGKISSEEKKVLAVFVVTALAWVCRSYLIQPYLPAIDDTVIAISGALVLFMIPGKDQKSRLLKWSDTAKLPWGVLLLFGGGIALAVGFDESGLAIWLGEQLSGLQGMSILALLVILILSVNFLTEITSNLATTSVILPILAPLAITVDMHPFALMVATAMAASCAFMLPVATPPNAIVFGSGYFKISDMLKVGIWLNFISVAILFLLIYFLLPILWDLDITSFPKELLKIRNP